jgi:hypothetical protein
MVGCFADLAYDLEQTTQMVKEEFEKKFENPTRYTSCLFVYATAQRVFLTLASLSADEIAKHRELLDKLLKG